MAKPDFIPQPEGNANILALSYGFENYVNESLQKLLETWRPIGSQLLYPAPVAPDLPSLVHLHSCRLTARCAKSSPTLRWEVFKHCDRNRSSLCIKSTKSDPQTFPCLALERPFPGPHHGWSPFIVCHGEACAYAFSEDWSFLSLWPPPLTCMFFFFLLLHNKFSHNIMASNKS